MSKTIDTYGGHLALFSGGRSPLEGPLMGIQVGDVSQARLTEEESKKLILAIVEFWGPDVAKGWRFEP